MKQPDYERFFRAYIAALNSSVTGEVDVDAIRMNYAEYFVCASVGSVVQGGANDERYADALRHGTDFYKAIGLQGMTLLRVESTPIDDEHDMVRPYLRADYRKKDGSAGLDRFRSRLLHSAPPGRPENIQLRCRRRDGALPREGACGRERETGLSGVSPLSSARAAPRGLHGRACVERRRQQHRPR